METNLAELLKGFRTEIKKKTKVKSHVLYAQLYSTDKIPVVQSENQKFVASFDFNDVLSNSMAYIKFKKRLQTVWPKMIHSNYGQRFELRMGSEAFKWLYEQQMNPLLDIIKSADILHVPNYHISYFKLLMGSTIGTLIENHRSKKDSPTFFRTIAILTVLLKGLVSRLDESSYFREIWKILDIQGSLDRTGRICFPNDLLCEKQWYFILPEKILKVHITNLD